MAMKQAMLSLATGVEVHGRNHLSVVLLLTAALTVTWGNNGTGGDEMNGVANLIVSIELGFGSLNATFNSFVTPQ
jgi:hypothetical protein